MPLPSSVNPNQLVDIWTELTKAYFGRNSYGGHTAEIYGYRISQYDPCAEHGPKNGEAASTLEQTNRQALAMIVRAFEKRLDCRCTINGQRVNVWERRGNFAHRVHIVVYPT